MQNRPRKSKIGTIEKINEGSASGAEAVEHLSHQIHFVHDALQYSSDIGNGTEGAEGAENAGEATALGEAVHLIPIVAHFIRGLIYWDEAIQALQNPKQENRKLKIATGLIAGAISVGAGIVAALALASIGMLASATAIALLPILIPSVITGIYAATAVRDVYFYYVKRKQEQSLQNAIHQNNAYIIAVEQNATISDPAMQIRLKAALDNRNILQKQLAVVSRQRKIAGNKAIFSTAIMVGVGILSMAIFATGLGALVMTAVGLSAVLGTIAVRYFTKKTPHITAETEPVPHHVVPEFEPNAEHAPEPNAEPTPAPQPALNDVPANAPDIRDLPPEEANPPLAPPLQLSAAEQTAMNAALHAHEHFSTATISAELHMPIHRIENAPPSSLEEKSGVTVTKSPVIMHHEEDKEGEGEEKTSRLSNR